MFTSMSKRARIAAALAALFVVVTGALATAAWLAGGSGNGSAKATTSQSLTLNDASASVTAQLYPGGSGDVKVSITNPNPFPVQLSSITQSGAITSDQGSACDASTGVSYTAPGSLAGAAYNIGAGQTKVVTLTGAVAMSNASDNSCQGATFTIPVTVSAASAA
jgi:hypothetical protein